MKYLSVLLLITLAIFSTGCKTNLVENPNSLWLEPIEFSQKTKAWLIDQEPLPSFVLEDLHKIAVLNDTIRAIRR